MASKRKPSGIPTGGQFAPGVHNESDIRIGDCGITEPADIAAAGFDATEAAMLHERGWTGPDLAAAFAVGATRRQVITAGGPDLMKQCLEYGIGPDGWRTALGSSRTAAALQELAELRHNRLIAERYHKKPAVKKMAKIDPITSEELSSMDLYDCRVWCEDAAKHHGFTIYDGGTVSGGWRDTDTVTFTKVDLGTGHCTGHVTGRGVVKAHWVDNDEPVDTATARVLFESATERRKAMFAMRAVARRAYELDAALQNVA